MSEYQVQLNEVFSGPMDLLLYLVRKEEVDIYDISISQITTQYLNYIDILHKLDTDIAGDFLVMAATLMEIKSAMLLPSASIDDEDVGPDGDPRSDLIRQLLEYKKFKDTAGLLELRAQGQMHRHKRPDGYIKRLDDDKEPELDLEEVSVWTLLETFDALMQATGRYRDYSLIKDETSIDEYEVEILDRLQKEGPLTFEHIFQGKQTRLMMVGLFLAMLELIRDKLIWAEQSDETEVIYLRPLTDQPAEEAVSNAMLANSDFSEESRDETDADLEKESSYNHGLES